MSSPSSSSFPQPEKHEGFTLVVSVTIQPDKVDEWLGHFWKAFDRVSAEPECLSFEVFRYPDQPNKVKWVENWSKSVAWFMENQISKAYMQAYLEATDPLLMGEREKEVLERFGGKWARAREGVYDKSY
ncbi:antibiotic biosynthesis monooxygenase [Diplodia corticola]|uniref:Antibiotic biosynthesis monooxygenase n=1 Tax=Diplodia corticola TaxID=236234 RepID=A0A1J9R1Z6_9PEZI|nr:antibiotic biosynthesis monooxygenase [Diplodia corticola]OJD34266.1 antibiotic biosynthesis monooxygenase [Diplodia corticola]